ncbi:MAG: hypothetical protein GY855_17945 [candidate division Zixibacteria bacterium]|nr:hypothetical protein [candidate division Zixibacteria bacterium]
MKERIGIFITILITILLLVFQLTAVAGDKVLTPVSVDRQLTTGDSPKVFYHGFTSNRCDRNILNLKRDKPWGLPKLSTTMADPADTIRVLVMRFDFQYENPDDTNTTGRGRFDLRDFEDFKEEYGHEADPSPHNLLYFEKHMEVLNHYYLHVSDSNLVIEWDVYPKDTNGAYHLPNNMAHYGTGQTSDEIYQNLIDSFFIDCFQLVDSEEVGLTFADYDANILFHAGSDRQNDLGFPPTLSDLYTGYVRRGDDRAPIYVNDSSYIISDGIIMPEMASQDNRATAINAVLAHEFGHQLGLVDLYRTDNFFTQLGDFALMDNNGFGTGIDLGFEFVGRVFGIMPVYPSAWSRAYLGFIEPVVYRQNADISLVASEMISNEVRIARIPITEFEYYLLENRQIDTDGRGDPRMLADSATSVFIGPVYYNPLDSSKTFTNEYDFLLPGSGILIWHVDESVAAMSLPGSNFSLFETNRVQVDPDHRFIELIEADGLVNFGGNFYAGYGSSEDMYRFGNNSSFTPNTNPATIGYNGTNSHIRITDISSSNTTMTFSLEYDLQSENFPRRAGYPVIGFSPIAADVDDDGTEEIITVSGNNLIVIDESGGGWFESSIHPPFIDTSYNSVGQTADSVPIFAITPHPITSTPVYGDFGFMTDSVVKFIAVGAYNKLCVYSFNDENNDGRADTLFTPIQFTGGIVVSTFFDTTLHVAVSFDSEGMIRVFSLDYFTRYLGLINEINEDAPYGFTQAGNSIIALAGDADSYVDLFLVDSNNVYSDTLDGFFQYGPIAADLNRDDTLEIIMVTDDGLLKIVSVDPEATGSPFVSEIEYDLGDSIYVNPIVADLDTDGYPDIILCGKNKIYALNRSLTPLSNFPIPIDRRFPDVVALSSPVVADIDGDNRQDIIITASNGNCYAYGPDQLYGFPLPIGGIGVQSILLNGSEFDNADFKNIASQGYGSPVIYNKTTGGGLGFLGGDGWFYSWDVDYDTSLAQWPMYGGNYSGNNYLSSDKLIDPVVFADNFSDDDFYCYPNPTTDGRTTIRYFLGEAADVTLSFYDMIGNLVNEQKVTGVGGVPNEFDWNGSFLTTGVYRCIIRADFNGAEQTSFIDIAIVK